MFYLLRIFAVFSVVISISGSVKYSDATHLPFSAPERKHRHRHTGGGYWGLLLGSKSMMHDETKPNQKKACGSVQSCSQVTIMFCDSYDSRGQKLAFSFFFPLLLSHSAGLFYPFLCICRCDDVDTCSGIVWCVCVRNVHVYLSSTVVL